MTAPPGHTPTSSPTAGRNQADAAKAAWRDRRNKRVRAEVEADFREQESMPRKRKLHAADTRIGGPVWRLRT